ncbi:class I histocompatibility antigen, F10 alpha chain-like [Brachyhypopomus gauderio]|uniref:class I histocompatibility antigen, F10 alpha chain-like n=1 Tax=Brachyhypopomus gauderio TaxID=698409 RepID=UPI004041D9C1
MIPKTEWMEKSEGAEYWDEETQIQQGTQELFKNNIAVLMERFNQTKGVHSVQWMYGCKLDDDGTKRGHMQYGYDGEDFISLDMNTATYIAPNPKAFITKNKWDDVKEGSRIKAYLENTCIEWLQKYVDYGRDTLERKDPPEVSVYQKGSSSAVCHATGFFPKGVTISWQKDGEDVNENVELTEPLPNHDGSFQKRSILTISPEDQKNHKYTCVVQHSALEKDIVMTLPEGGVSIDVIIGVAVSLLLVLIGCVGFFIWRKKKKNDFKPVAASDGERSSTSSNDQTPSH